MARIGIDARIYGTRKGGIGRYVEELSYALPLCDKKNTFVFFMRKGDINSFKPRSRRVEKIFAPIAPYSLAEQLIMPQLFSLAKIDLLHAPHLNIPLFYRGPLIVTVHDLIEYNHNRAEATTLPKAFYNLKYGFFRKVVKDALSKATAVIVPSLYTKGDLARNFPDMRLKPVLIPHGLTVLRHESKKGKDLFKRAEPYLIYVGSAAPHKNVLRMLYVFRECVEAEHISEHLVLVIPRDFHRQKITRTLSSFPQQVQERVHFFTDLKDDALRRLIAGARLLLSPSLEEGYGMPFLEAMASGIPVLGGFVGALPEVAPLGFFYWDPRHIPSMRKSLISALHTSPHEISGKFTTWNDAAKAHIALYREVLGR